MKKIILIATIFLLTSFISHKFYVSIYKVEFNQKNKQLEITARIFIDDLEAAIQKQYNQKIVLDKPNPNKEDLELLKKYLSENILININTQNKNFNLSTTEIDLDEIICYLSIKNISKIKSIEIKNTTLFNLHSKQQNIIQTKIYDKKKNITLTSDKTSFVLKF